MSARFFIAWLRYGPGAGRRIQQRAQGLVVPGAERGTVGDWGLGTGVAAAVELSRSWTVEQGGLRGWRPGSMTNPQRGSTMRPALFAFPFALLAAAPALAEAQADEATR